MNELSDVKVGDTLAYRADFGRSWRTVEIAKVGKVHLIDTHGTKYRIAGGGMVGESAWNSRRVMPITPDIAAEIAVQSAREYINRDWSKLTDDEALAAAAAMQAALKPAPATTES